MKRHIKMRKKTDYYEYWNKNRKDKNKLFDREKIAFKLISKIIKKGDFFLDAGCGNGKFMKLISKNFPNLTLKGIDYSKKEVLEAKKKGLNVKQGDLEQGINFKKNSFDIVFSGEIIEHLYDPDFLLSEANRVLKKDGFLVLTTPNLCAWFNRILFLFGIQPLFLEPSTKSKLIGAGFLKRFKKESQPVGHVRIFTLGALKDLLKESGFKIIKIRGSIFSQGLPKWILLFDKMFKIYPSLSSDLVIIAKKIEDK